MTKYRCYFLTAENKAEACSFIEAASALEAAAEAKRRFQGTGYAAVEVWDEATNKLAFQKKSPSTPAHEGRVPHPGAHVIFVDDEPVVRAITANLLREEGFIVTEAESAHDVLAKFEAGMKFDLLLTDVRMPGMSGFELANRVAVCSPEVKVIYLTGHPIKESGPLDTMRAGAELLHKPVPIARLAHAVRRALAAR
jgi:CheY-like chemotaxis protein